MPDTVANFYFISCVAHSLRAIFLDLLIIFEFILAFDKFIGNALITYMTRVINKQKNERENRRGTN